MVSMGAGWQPSRWVDDFGADYVTAPGQVQTVTLADQSQVTLDADSATYQQNSLARLANRRDEFGVLARPAQKASSKCSSASVRANR